MPPLIPDRWIPYKACGNIIEGTRIICFKVPIRRSVQVNKKEIREIWDIKTLIERIPKLGAVVDLTNTTRYYHPKDFVSAGILHRKILMPGHILPPEDKVQQFMDTVDEFLGKDCEMVVGVHCTHGLNRTGYMVCRYMRDRLGVAGKDAIKKFEKARGYKIERANYIADILGKKPPPPDPFAKTKIKPVSQESELSWRNRDEQETTTSKQDRFKSWGSRSKQNVGDRHNSGVSSMSYQSPLQDFHEDDLQVSRDRYRKSGSNGRRSYQSPLQDSHEDDSQVSRDRYRRSRSNGRRSDQSPLQDSHEDDSQVSRDRYRSSGSNGRRSRWNNTRERSRSNDSEQSYDYRHDY